MKTFLAAALAAVALAAPAFAEAPAVTAQFAAATAAQNQIPPNCTLDPWTGKLNCVIWPTCTLDPFTGRMNCPVPPPVRRP